MGEVITIAILVIAALVYIIHYVKVTLQKPQQCVCEHCPVSDCKERKERQ